MTNDDMTQSTRDGSQIRRKDGELNREATRKGKITTDHGRAHRRNRFGPISEDRDTVRIGHTVLGKQLLPQYRREGTFKTMRNEGKNGRGHMQPGEVTKDGTQQYCRHASGLQQELQAQTKVGRGEGYLAKRNRYRGWKAG